MKFAHSDSKLPLFYLSIVPIQWKRKYLGPNSQKSLNFHCSLIKLLLFCFNVAILSFLQLSTFLSIISIILSSWDSLSMHSCHSPGLNLDISSSRNSLYPSKSKLGALFCAPTTFHSFQILALFILYYFLHLLVFIFYLTVRSTWAESWSCSLEYP